MMQRSIGAWQIVDDAAVERIAKFVCDVKFLWVAGLAIDVLKITGFATVILVLQLTTTLC